MEVKVLETTRTPEVNLRPGEQIHGFEVKARHTDQRIAGSEH